MSFADPMGSSEMATIVLHSNRPGQGEKVVVTPTPPSSSSIRPQATVAIAPPSACRPASPSASESVSSSSSLSSVLASFLLIKSCEDAFDIVVVRVLGL